MIDLHMHSTFSDGTDTPERLIELARKKNIKAVALSDHDTFAGIPQLLAAAKKTNIKALAAVELSLDFADKSLHMLGYLPSLNHQVLKNSLAQIQDGRTNRNLRIIKKLQDCGIDIEYEDVKKHAGEDVIARPHFAKALVEKKVVIGYQQAFDQYLTRDGKAYEERFRLSLKDGVEQLRAAGGVPVLAHPCLLPLSDTELRELLKKLTDYGLLGIEVFYSLHSETQIQYYSKLAKDFGLLRTGGSDYHGTNKNIQIGFGNGDLRVPNELLEPIIEAATSDLATCSMNIV